MDMQMNTTKSKAKKISLSISSRDSMFVYPRYMDQTKQKTPKTLGQKKLKDKDKCMQT